MSPTLTDDQIAAALDRAIAIRRQHTREPLRAIPMTAASAIEATQNHQWHTQRTRMMQGQVDAAQSWLWIGWLSEGRDPELGPPQAGEAIVARTWTVWLDPETDRIWLKPQ